MRNIDQINTVGDFENVEWKTIRTPRHWYENEPIVTHFFNALSLGIPETERFLVQTVKSVMHEISSPELYERAVTFIREENTHSLQHTKFNADLNRHGYPVRHILKLIRMGYRFINKCFTRRTRLAMSACLEHMTAVIATYGFDNELMTENVSDVYDLFIWHAYEELNHRALAYDLYQHLGGRYWVRCLSMVYISFIFILGVAGIQSLLVLYDLVARKGGRFRHYMSAFKFFFARRGLIWGSLKHYASFYHLNYLP